ncbi:hypothetical protein GAY28_29155, partial [Azospirillum brasilense]|nr:hypothetical protein [Azospirillum brasilense]
MGDFTLRTADRRDATLSQEAVNDLAARLRGPLLTPQSPGYGEARRVWNRLVGRRPGPGRPSARAARASPGGRPSRGEG